MQNGITNIVRPSTMNDLVGLSTQRRQIEMCLEGSRKRNVAPPSFLMGGPSGCGKTTLASIIGTITGRDVHKITGTDLRTVDDVYDLVTRCKDWDVVYIEEAHTMGGTGKAGKHIQAVIYEWIEDFRITSGQNGIVTAPGVCFIFATTDPGKLLEPLRNRCARVDVKLYTILQLRDIIYNAALKLGYDFSVDEDALYLLAQSSRGLPRVAIMGRLDKILNYMTVHEKQFNLQTVEEFFELMNVNEYGLEANDKLYCETLHTVMTRQEGRPVAAKTIQQMTALADNLVTEVIEPYLLQVGFIEITGRGRVLTPLACSKLGLAPIATTAVERAKYAHLQIENLPDMLEDENVRKLGISGLMGLFGMKYSNAVDRETFKVAMESAGYTSKRRAGITKLRESQAQL